MPWVSAPSTSSGYTGTGVYALPSSARSPIWGPLPCAITSSCAERDRSEVLTRGRDARTLVLDRHRLTASEERVASERDDDPHVTVVFMILTPVSSR